MSALDLPAEQAGLVGLGCAVLCCVVFVLHCVALLFVLLTTHAGRKSSVLTALANSFEFPSSSELCTRCPTQVVLTAADERKAVVSASSAAVKRETHANASDSIVAEAIARVQQELVAANGGGSGKSKKVTKESIVIELSGPAMPNVTLIDLPGLIKANLTDQVGRSCKCVPLDSIFR